MNSVDSKAIIGAYRSQGEAVDALQILKKNKFPLTHVALIGKNKATKHTNSVSTWESFMVSSSKTGGLLGLPSGIFLGTYIKMIPPMDLSPQTELILSILAGIIISMATGALIGSLLGSFLGIFVGSEGQIYGTDDPEDINPYSEIVEDDRYIIVVRGPEEEIATGHEILDNDTPYAHVGSFRAN